jgi:hypothetical protein
VLDRPVTGTRYVLAALLVFLLESTIVILLLALFQKAGEVWTISPPVPWGGIGLLLTWGVANLGTHPQGAIYVLVFSVLFVVAFVVSRKSFAVTLAIIYLAFLL